MVSYAGVRDNHRELLALTGLTAREFRQLPGGFARSYEIRHPAGRTVAGSEGAGADPRRVIDGPDRTLSRARVGVGHVIAGAERSRIVTGVPRDTTAGVSDAAMEPASALHNLRARAHKHRLNRYQNAAKS